MKNIFAFFGVCSAYSVYRDYDTSTEISTTTTDNSINCFCCDSDYPETSSEFTPTTADSTTTTDADYTTPEPTETTQLTTAETTTLTGIELRFETTSKKSPENDYMQYDVPISQAESDVYEELDEYSDVTGVQVGIPPGIQLSTSSTTSTTTTRTSTSTTTSTTTSTSKTTTTTTTLTTEEPDESFWGSVGSSISNGFSAAKDTISSGFSAITDGISSAFSYFGW
jgi:hypothetical protein